MFEKEAEEYAKQNNPAEYGVRATHFTVLNSFKDGAEFGYNKANEWHDLKKNPNDLPKDCKNVLINALDYGINTCYVAHRLNGKWWSNCKSETFIRVIAWKEIVLPKEIKENEL